MTKLDLSVALIVKNEEDRLPLTLNAIHNIASEIILVDSGSTDNTIEIAKALELKYIHTHGKGLQLKKTF